MPFLLLARTGLFVLGGRDGPFFFFWGPPFCTGVVVEKSLLLLRRKEEEASGAVVLLVAAMVEVNGVVVVMVIGRADRRREAMPLRLADSDMVVFVLSLMCTNGQ